MWNSRLSCADVSDPANRHRIVSSVPSRKITYGLSTEKMSIFRSASGLPRRRYFAHLNALRCHVEADSLLRRPCPCLCPDPSAMAVPSHRNRRREACWGDLPDSSSQALLENVPIIRPDFASWTTVSIDLLALCTFTLVARAFERSQRSICIVRRSVEAVAISSAELGSSGLIHVRHRPVGGMAAT